MENPPIDVHMWNLFVLIPLLFFFVCYYELFLGMFLKKKSGLVRILFSLFYSFLMFIHWLLPSIPKRVFNTMYYSMAVPVYVAIVFFFYIAFTVVTIFLVYDKHFLIGVKYTMLVMTS